MEGFTFDVGTLKQTTLKQTKENMKHTDHDPEKWYECKWSICGHDSTEKLEDIN